MSNPAILKQVDDLIEQRNLNGALAIIQQYLKDYPEDFDNAQKRIKVIMKVRKNYSKQAENLFHVLAKEPENNKKQLQIIADLEGMEKNPSPTTQKFIKTAKSAAQFTYYRSLYNKIMEDGSKQKSKAEYTKAVTTFHSGMYLYQNEFFESDYDVATTKRIRSEISDLQKYITTANLQLDDLRAKYAILLQDAKERNYAKTLNDFKTFQLSYEKFSATRNEIAQIGWDFKATYASLRQIDEELTDASFLPFAFRFILGDEKIEDTGIIVTLDHQWQEMIPTLLALFDKQILIQMTEGINFINTKEIFTTKNFQKTDGTFTLANQYIQLEKDINSIYELKKINSKEYDTSHKKDILSRTAVAVEFINEVNAQEKNLSTLVTLNADVKAKKFPSANDVKANNAFINYMIEATQGYKNIISSNEKYQEMAKKSKTENWDSPFITYDEICVKITDECNTQMTNIWLSLAKHYDKEAINIAEKYKSTIDKAEELLNREKIPSDETGTVKSKPTETLPLLDQQFAQYKQDMDNLNKCLDRLQNLPTDISDEESVEIAEHIANIQKSIDNLTKLQEQNIELTTYAKEQIQLAQRAQNEAELRLSQSRENLRRNEFTQARDNLQKARTKYNEALSYSDSDKLREKTDAQIENLATEINHKHNEVVVAEVRNLKNQAKQAFKDGNFELADSLLTQAQDQWSITNIDQDEEIVDMFSLINTALSIKTGRTIPLTSPLYPEMSNLLSIANQYYDKGAVLIREGKTDEAIKILREAEKKLAEVRVSFPLNQDSRLLSLKIQKLIDEKKFQQQFEKDVNEAISIYKSNKDKRQEAYITLVDLSQIQPDYPGLKQEIFNIEIDLGMRLPPPDPKAIARSRTLTREATTLYNTARDEMSMSTALAKINEAIRLDTDNNEAKQLKDKIQTRLGGKASVVLSAESERVYQMAIQELQKGNIVQASALVSQLMQKSENQRSAKILDLKKKVDSFL